MSSASPPLQATRGPANELHLAAKNGATERTLLSILSRGTIDIDQGNSHGTTPLMIAAHSGHSRVARVLLNKGARVSILNQYGFNALHKSTGEGHLAVTKLLVKAGADLEAQLFHGGSTPLHLAAGGGHSELVELLIKAGAHPNRRAFDGSTPLYHAAWEGHVRAVKVLLRAKANPLLTSTNPSGHSSIALDAAAQSGQSDVVSELVRQLGIDGCGGVTGGAQALWSAAQARHMEIVATLTSAGVIDKGRALVGAVANGCEASVGLLLQQYNGTSEDKRAYVNTQDHGAPPLFYAVGFAGVASVRVVRLLVNAGANTTSTVLATNYDGVVFNGTPLEFTTRVLREKTINGTDATEHLLHRLEAIHRLLLRVEAVHAVSWLWPTNSLSATHVAAEGASRADETSTPLRSMLLVLRRRASRPRMLLAPLLSYSKKP